MSKILMVCLGNICRSPLAEGILQSKTDSSTIWVDSAGTSGYHVGSLPDKRSIAVAKAHGIDISYQRCRKFSVNDFSTFDYIFVMDNSNYNDVISLARSVEEKEKVRLILNEVNLSVTEVPDPYYGGPNGFEYVFELLDNACTEIAIKLTNGRA